MKICIFCGANSGNSQFIIDESKKLCDFLADKNFELVYGGGKKGLMGVAADAFLVKGQKVTGIRPEKLIIAEDAHDSLNQLIVVNDMFERKSKMIEMADVFIALPGGVGTLDEIVEVFTQVKIGFTDKICCVFNPDNYYEGLQILLDNMIGHSFLAETHLTLLHFESDPEKLVNWIMEKYNH